MSVKKKIVKQLCIGGSQSFHFNYYIFIKQKSILYTEQLKRKNMKIESTRLFKHQTIKN